MSQNNLTEREKDALALFLGTLDCQMLSLEEALANVELDSKSLGWSRLATRTLASQVRLKYAQPFGHNTVERRNAVAWAKARWEEAYKADPYHTEELTALVLGPLCVNGVFVWDNLPLATVRALSSAVFATCLAARA